MHSQIEQVKDDDAHQEEYTNSEAKDGKKAKQMQGKNGGKVEG